MLRILGSNSHKIHYSSFEYLCYQSFYVFYYYLTIKQLKTKQNEKDPSSFDFGHASLHHRYG